MNADASDEQLSAELKKWTGAPLALHPVGELLDRHWEAAFSYARLCTAGPRAAGMLTTAAFTRLFGETIRQSGPSAAWRPHLLVTVRRIAAEWDGDGRRELLHPAVLPSPRSGERAVARLLPPAERRLLSRAFQRLPQAARAVLWHTEVEGDPLAVPAALLALDEEETGTELRRARERLREECLQAHHELAPETECRRYQRMLDVTFRRGGVDIDPDLGQHLAGCRHCGRTADQLARFNAGLGLALAEAVLGWGARAYIESRAARTDDGPVRTDDGPVRTDDGPVRTAGTADEAAAPGARTAAAPFPPPGGEAFLADAAPDAPAAPPGRPAGTRAAPGPAPRRPMRRTPAGSRPRPGPHPERGAATGPFPTAASTALPPDTAPPPREGTHGSHRSHRSHRSPRSAHRAARRTRRRTLALAVVTVGGMVVLPLVLWSVLGSHDAPAPAPGATPSRATGSQTTSPPDPSWARASATAQGALHGQLHSLASGLCVGVAGQKAVRGAETELAPCSATPSQQWTYESDGLLRNASAPGLCLDSHLGYSVRLAPCSATGQAARNIRYDFTLQGTLVPRGSQDLALTPAATDGSGALVTKNRTGAVAEHWTLDTARPDLRMEIVDWDSAATPAPTAPGAGAWGRPR
ncbi:ricin-type beta-trefoil lectin domain protein [Streptomyces sp. NPDC048297]|uniref:ricin-type beta-trefoil lectin domain protein n=1 Tax=Streptomyces sp. NPDC048297 TaxID=3365531 RepID=UPI0037143FF9